MVNDDGDSGTAAIAANLLAVSLSSVKPPHRHPRRVRADHRRRVQPLLGDARRRRRTLVARGRRVGARWVARARDVRVRELQRRARETEPRHRVDVPPRLAERRDRRERHAADDRRRPHAGVGHPELARDRRLRSRQRALRPLEVARRRPGGLGRRPRERDPPDVRALEPEPHRRRSHRRVPRGRRRLARRRLALGADAGDGDGHAVVDRGRGLGRARSPSTASRASGSPSRA